MPDTDRPAWLILLEDGSRLEVPEGTLTHPQADDMGIAIPNGVFTPPAARLQHPHVYAAIAAVMAEMPAVPKDGVMSDGGNWKYRGIEGITAAIQHLMGRHGVVPIPHVISREVESLTRGQGSKWTLDTLHIAYRLHGPGGHEDRTDEIGPFVCLGLDNSDKGTNKAMTMGLKQMLLQVFVIGNGTDDPDAHNTEARPAGAEPQRIQTWEEWAAMNGWGDDPAEAKRALDAAKNEAKAAINSGDYDDDTKRLLWRDYSHPDGHDADENGVAPRARPRRLDEHIAWWKANVETEDNPLDTAPPADTPGPAENAPRALTEAVTPEPTQDTPEPPQATQEAPDPDIADNGFRDEWNRTMAQGGIDAVIHKLAATPITELVHALQARDFPAEGSTDAATLRRQLGSRIFAEHQTPAPVDEPEANLPASREHIGSTEGSKLHAYASLRKFSPEEFEKIVTEASRGRTNHARLLNAAEASAVRTELNTRPLPPK